MNYLVHLYLAGPTPESQLGNLMGDFVKGRLGDAWPPAVRRGIEMHRRVDHFAHDHPTYRRSRARLDPAFGHCRGVMIDIFYDHFLARNWERHHPLPLPEFARQVYGLLTEHFAILPPGLQEVAPRMIAHDWLFSYRDTATIGRVLERVSARLSRPNPLGLGMTELQRNYRELEEDCELFLVQARDFVRQWQQGAQAGDQE